MSNRWPEGKKETSSGIVKGGGRLKQLKNRSIKGIQFGNHEGLGKRVVEGEDKAQAEYIRKHMNSLLTLHERVEYVVQAIREVQAGKTSLEAFSAGIQGFVQELRLAHEQLETEKLRSRRKK